MLFSSSISFMTRHRLNHPPHPIVCSSIPFPISQRSIPGGELLVQSTCQNGLPPQIKDLKWSPGQQYTEFITREHKGPCNVLCTAGDKHLRVWSFSSPKAASSATLVAGGAYCSVLPSFLSSLLCLDNHRQVITLSQPLGNCV